MHSADCWMYPWQEGFCMPSYAWDARTLKVNYFTKLYLRLKKYVLLKVQYDSEIAVIWLLKFSRLLEVNTWQQKETLLQKQVQIRSLILCLCLSHHRRRNWKKGKSAKCWRCYQSFRFKSWHRPAIQVQTLKKLVSDIFLWLLIALLGKTAGVCECREGIQ